MCSDYHKWDELWEKHHYMLTKGVLHHKTRDFLLLVRMEGDKLQSHLEGCQEGYKLQRDAHHEVKQRLEKIRMLMKESYDGEFEELWNGLVEILS